VFLDVTRYAAFGLVTGLVIATAFARRINQIFLSVTENNPRGVLFEVGPGSPIVRALVVATVLILVLLASLFPVRRAVRIQPTLALRGWNIMGCTESFAAVLNRPHR
jgi:ABC-type lipoprotein release transport system permease subunit